jgi:hypothetical protein
MLSSTRIHFTRSLFKPAFACRRRQPSPFSKRRGVGKLIPLSTLSFRRKPESRVHREWPILWTPVTLSRQKPGTGMRHGQQLSYSLRRWKGICFLIWCSLFVCCSSINAVWAYTPEDCIRCHQKGSKASSLQIDVEAFKRSAHGATFSCLDCHGHIQDESHGTMKASSAVSCTGCHEQENRHGLSQGRDQRPNCYSCHTRHRILGKGDPSSSVYPAALKKTCAGCHPSECGREDYLSWFPSLLVVSHGKEDLSRAYDRGNCLGCHQGAGAHGEKKPINDQDCTKCHNDMIGFMHPKADSATQPEVLASAWIYQVFLAGLLWGGFRFYTRRRRAKGEDQDADFL